MLCLADEVFGNRVANKEKLLLSFFCKKIKIVFFNENEQGQKSKLRTHCIIHENEMETEKTF